jgi:hypothetical protein
MIKWTDKAVEAAIKGWFGKWASDEERMLNALNKALEAQGLKEPVFKIDYDQCSQQFGSITIKDIIKSSEC